MTCKFRIATTQSGLSRGYFFLLRIPPPSLSEYKDHSVRFSQSLGGVSLQGYKKSTLVWDQLAPFQAVILRKKVEEALSGSGFLYMTINRSNGTKSGFDWIDVRGIPHLPDFRPDGRIAGSSSVSIMNTELILNNITIIADPSQA